MVIFYETDVLGGPGGEFPALQRVDGPIKRTPRDFALPGWTDDLLTKYRGGKLDVRRKRSRPTVGFCGYAPPLGMPLGKAKLKESVRWVLNRTGTIRYVQPGYRVANPPPGSAGGLLRPGSGPAASAAERTC